MVFKFKNLKVWQRVSDLSKNIYGLIEPFPEKKIQVITSQIQQPYDSVELNSEDEYTERSNVEFNLFLPIALGSAREVAWCLHTERIRNSTR
ncbi:MAG: hypothetical protein OJF59_002689 [Cytophagales bacterium]|jgi:four helix bundle protein|nr:four helix bundle protein [Bacteroidota bacterium]WHZ08935.1 MAG: hypothetical protein OJF59_002689 [Cytophagales bacterium]